MQKTADNLVEPTTQSVAVGPSSLEGNWDYVDYTTEFERSSLSLNLTITDNQVSGYFDMDRPLQSGVLNFTTGDINGVYNSETREMRGKWVNLRKEEGELILRLDSSGQKLVWIAAQSPLGGTDFSVKEVELVRDRASEIAEEEKEWLISESNKFAQKFSKQGFLNSIDVLRMVEDKAIAVVGYDVNGNQATDGDESLLVLFKKVNGKWTLMSDWSFDMSVVKKAERFTAWRVAGVPPELWL